MIPEMEVFIIIVIHKVILTITILAGVISCPDALLSAHEFNSVDLFPLLEWI